MDSSAELPMTARIGPFVVQQKLGSGAFSTVYIAVHPETNLKVAIKDIQIKDVKDPKFKTHLVREINIVKSAQSNFIAQLFDVVETKDHVYLILEYVENGNLAQHIGKVGPMNGDYSRATLARVVMILDYLHNQMYIAHRDIKAENVLIDKFWNIKLVDFGLCNHFTTPEQHFRSICGSIQYLAPEIIKSKPYTKAVDIWSAGVLIYFVTIGRFPFEDISMQLLLGKITTAEPQFPSGLDQDLTDLIKKMLCKDPKLRITANQMKEHPYFRNFDFDQISNTPPTVTTEEIKALMVDRNINFEIMKKPENEILMMILKKELQNSKVIMSYFPSKEPPTKRTNHAKKLICFDMKKPDPMKVLAKRYVHGQITLNRKRKSLSDTNETDQSTMPKTKLEMST